VRLVKLALLVTLVAAVPASAQEPPLPEGAIARVGDEPVLKSDFDAWHGLLAGQTKWLASDPPDYQLCIATFRERAAKHGRHPTRRSLRHRCEERAELIRDSAVGVALMQVWVRQEAQRLGIVLSLQEVARRVARLKRSANDDDVRLLERAGMTDAQISGAIASTMLFERLIERARAKARDVTQAQIERYYAQHRRKYRGLPRRRALERIEARLTRERRWRATFRFIANLYTRYRKLTVCAEGYRAVGMCANAKNPGYDEDFRQSSTSIATLPGAGYTGAVPTTIAQPSSCR
jgi:hypothetical protein